MNSTLLTMLHQVKRLYTVLINLINEEYKLQNAGTALHIHNVRTRCSCQLHAPVGSLPAGKTGIHCTGDVNSLQRRYGRGRQEKMF